MRKKNPVELDTKAKEALIFVWRYGGWHSFAHDVITLRAIVKLAGAGFIEINQYSQFKISMKGREWARRHL